VPQDIDQDSSTKSTLARGESPKVDKAPESIQARLPQLARPVLELCLNYETDSNRGWWEAADA
jgi:hypothetical protein